MVSFLLFISIFRCCYFGHIFLQLYWISPLVFFLKSIWANEIPTPLARGQFMSPHIWCRKAISLAQNGHCRYLWLGPFHIILCKTMHRAYSLFSACWIIPEHSWLKFFLKHIFSMPRFKLRTAWAASSDRDHYTMPLPLTFSQTLILFGKFVNLFG